MLRVEKLDHFHFHKYQDMEEKSQRFSKRKNSGHMNIYFSECK